jgi:hypothetical protein
VIRRPTLAEIGISHFAVGVLPRDNVLPLARTNMPTDNPIAEHWAKDDIYEMILSALQKAGKALDGLTVEDLAPVDHFHARGFPATVELADRVALGPHHHLLDIGCASAARRVTSPCDLTAG